MAVDKNDIHAVLGGMLAAFDRENAAAYESISTNPVLREAKKAAKQCNQEIFYHSLIYPLSKFIDGMLGTVTDDHHAKFYLKHGEFVERHFNKWINCIEGMPCCSDKSRTIMRNLIGFYMTGRKIEFNYDQEYTYHLPVTVFKAHNEIVDFADSLYSLYYGESEKYIEQVENLNKLNGK